MSISTPQEVVRVQIATHNVTSPVGSEIMSAQMGRSATTQESVQVSPSQSDLTDSLEELGMGVATRGKSDVEKMKVRKGAGSNLEALGRIAEYYDKLPSMPTDEKRRNLVQQFKQFEQMMRGAEREGGGSGLPTAEDVRKLLSEFDGDVAHQFVALEDLRSRAAAEGAPASYIALLDTVRAEMRRPETARDILAGFASAREAVRVGDRFGTDPSTYRDSYRQLLRETPQLGRVFDELRKFSLTENFDSVIGSFLKVAGDDMASFGPSTDPLILGDVIKELTNLKNLRTVLQSTDVALGKIDRMFPREEGSTRPNGEELASRLLNFSSGQVASMRDAEGLVTGFETARPEIPVVAINLIRDLHSALPDTVMTSPNAREQQSRLLMSLSDKLVAIEEAAYGD